MALHHLVHRWYKYITTFGLHSVSAAQISYTSVNTLVRLVEDFSKFEKRWNFLILKFAIYWHWTFNYFIELFFEKCGSFFQHQAPVEALNDMFYVNLTDTCMFTYSELDSLLSSYSENRSTASPHCCISSIHDAIDLNLANWY